MVRSIRDTRYRYQRNFYPHLPFAPYEDFQFEASVYAKWAELARQGKLGGDLEEYLGETNNLYTQHPEIVHRLKMELEKIKADENYNPTALK